MCVRDKAVDPRKIEAALLRQPQPSRIFDAPQWRAGALQLMAQSLVLMVATIWAERRFPSSTKLLVRLFSLLGDKTVKDGMCGPMVRARVEFPSGATRRQDPTITAKYAVNPPLAPPTKTRAAAAHSNCH